MFRFDMRNSGNQTNIVWVQVFVFISIAAITGLAQGKNIEAKKTTEIVPATKTAPTPNIKQTAIEAIVNEIERAKDYSHLKDRITIWTRAADIIWDVDSIKARKLLRDAYSLTKDVVAVKSENDSKSVVALKTDNLKRKLKTDILFVAHNRDAKLVKELIESFEKEDFEEVQKFRSSPTLFGSSSFSKRQLASLAAILAKSNPRQSVEYALASLGFGVPQEFNDVFRSLLASNRTVASELFSEATDHFLRDNSLNLYDGLILSGYLSLTQPTDSEQETARRLLMGAFVREQRVWQAIQGQNLTEEGLSEVILFTSQSLHRLFQLHYPERAGEVESFIRQVSLYLSKPTDFADEKISESKSSDDPEVLLEQAEKENDKENRNALYLEAALAFVKRKNFVRALSAAANATDEVKRSAVENYIRRLQAEHLIESNELNLADKVIEKIRDPELRAETAIVYARKARTEKLPQLAIQILIDTQKFLEKSFSSLEDARAYLWLASEYTSIDPVLGFELMGAAIRRANQARDFVDLDSSPKIVHLGGKSSRAVIIGDTKGDFRPGFRFLAKQNLIQTLLLAENFENKFLRGIAVLASSSIILEEELRREKTPKSKPQSKRN